MFLNPIKQMKLSEAATELELYATNVEAYIHPVIKNLSKHYKRGEFDLDKAIHAIERYCLTPAAKQYRIEHGSMSTNWQAMFPKAVRLEAAESIARHWVQEFRLGNYWD
tara:strand:+ start:4176 stop:4502 length:327 start_codon:yes stop_codon:yes gene_type:complete